jgi:two-component system OmpR family sensor kinase
VSRLSVRWRLTVVFACVMAILLTATAVFVHQRLESTLDKAVLTSLQAHAADVAALAQQADSGLADAKLGGVGTQPQLAQIVAADGRVLDSTPGLPRRALISPAALAQARRGGLVVRDTLVADDQPVRLLAVPIAAQDQRLVAVVGQSLEEHNRAIDDLTQVLLVGEPAALLLASLAGYALTGAALRPVEVMRRRERTFIADASHELRSPLTMLRTELELMARDEPSGAELQAATASAIEETARLSRLADDLLLLTRADSDRFELRAAPVSPAALVGDAVARARRRPSAASIQIAVGDVVDIAVLADRDRVGQALDNMLDNALRYAAGEVELTTLRAGASVEIHVRDDGPGFPPTFLPRAWERFSRADAARTDDGAGLGLSIIRTIAELHGGAADAANRPGGGADVWISLPAAT